VVTGGKGVSGGVSTNSATVAVSEPKAENPAAGLGSPGGATQI